MRPFKESSMASFAKEHGINGKSIEEKIEEKVNQKKFLNKKFVYNKINDNTRKKLIELYRPYNAQLYKIISRIFDWEK